MDRVALIRGRDRLPLLDGAFVEREQEQRALEAAFAGGAQIVTVLGPGGVGKTRLAVEWAAKRRDPRGPAVFVDLAGASSLAALTREVGDALDVPLFSGTTEEHVGRLGRSLAARGRLLLLLDDLDAMTEIARAPIERWCAQAADLRVLATSRVRLGAEGERVLVLGPLETAGPSSAASRLFVERAREHRAPVDPRDGEAVERIVTALEGVPLAIELAAARVRVASPRQLEGLLSQVLGLLADPSRPGQRHGSLRATLDESWASLEPERARALARASLFEGPFALEAAGALAPEAPAATRSVAALDHLHALVDRSLVQVREVPELGGERRFSMLSFVRAYAREKLEALGEARDAEAEHAREALAFIERLAEAASSDAAALRALLREARSAGAILERALARGDEPEQAAIAARAFVALGRVYVVRAATRAYLAWADRLEPHLAKVEPSLAGRAWAATGLVAIRGGDYVRAAASYERAIASLAERDPSYAAQLRARAASLKATRGELSQAEALHAQAASEPALEERDRMAIDVMGALIALRAGDEPRARAGLEAALASARRSGDRVYEGRALGYLAWCDLQARHLPQARARFEEAAARLAEMEEQRQSVAWAGDVATVLLDEGSIDPARERLLEAIDAHRRLGDRWYEAERLAELGHLELYAGRLEHAEPALREGARLLAEAGDAAQRAHFTAALALCVAERGASEEAAALLDAASDTPCAGLYRAGVELIAARGTVRFDEALCAARAQAARASEESSVAARVAGRTVAALAERLASRASGPLELVVAKDGAWLELGDERVAIEGTAARRLLAYLADRRLQRPGAAVPIDALFDASWPGEEASAGARKNRVRVALTRLRKLGLRSLLLARREGYLLDPTVALRAERA